MATEFRWLKTKVYGNTNSQLIGSHKELQIRETGLFGYDWTPVDEDHKYVYVDEATPAKVEGLVENYTKEVKS